MDTTLLIATAIGIAEAYMMMFCGFRLVGFPIPYKRLLPVAVAFALFMRISRYVLYTLMGAPFGVHMIIALAVFFLIGWLWFKLPVVLAAIGVVIGDMILSLGTLFILLVQPKIPSNDLKAIIIMALIEEAPLILATLVVWKTGVTIVPKRVTQNLKG